MDKYRLNLLHQQINHACTMLNEKDYNKAEAIIMALATEERMMKAEEKKHNGWRRKRSYGFKNRRTRGTSSPGQAKIY